MLPTNIAAVIATNVRQPVDWLIIVAVIGTTLGAALLFTKRARRLTHSSLPDSHRLESIMQPDRRSPSPGFNIEHMPQPPRACRHLL